MANTIKNPHTDEHATYHYSDGVNKCFDCDAVIEVDHNCMEYASHYLFESSRGGMQDGYLCGRCGAFLQVG